MKKKNPFFGNNFSFNEPAHLTLFFLLFLITSYFSYFYMLTALPVQLWDEGMFGVQAFEMNENHNWLIQYFDGIPDRENNKPPFAVWCIALSFKLFGINELALRLPSAIFGFLTSAALFYFVWKYTKNSLIGFVSALVLNMSIGFITIHVSRTGEADAILTFFVTVFALTFFLFLESEDVKKKRVYWLLFTLSITIASLTKSISALLLLPGIFLYIVIAGKFQVLLKQKEIYLSILFFIMVNAFYYLLREHFDPGNFRLVVERDILQRYFDNLGHNHPFFTYFENLITIRYIPWVFILPVCSFILLYTTRYRKIGLYLTINLITFLLIISFSGTKVFWYDEFVYPLGAVMIGLAIELMLERSSLTRMSQIGLCCLLFVIPFKNVISYGISLQGLPQDEEARYNSILSAIKKDNPAIQKLKVYYKVHPSHLLFYKKVMEDSTFKFSITDNVHEVDTGNVVVVCDRSLQKTIEAYYNSEILYFINGCYACRITEKRNDYLERRFQRTRQEAVNNQGWMFNIRQKAIANKVSVDQQLTEEIVYILKANQEINEEEGERLRKLLINDADRK
jgi:hypothetical protein